MSNEKPNPERSSDTNAKGLRPSRLAITLQGYRNCISIGKDVIRILGAPPHVCLRVTEDNSSIALAPCEAKDVMSFKVPDTLFADRHCIFRICSKQFVRNIMAINGMNPLQSYSFDGIYSEKQNAIMFMLNNTGMEE
jgi:hypothetical protein